MVKPAIEVRKYEVNETALPPYELRPLVGERTGIVQRLYESYLERDDPEISTYTIMQPHFERMFDTEFELEFRAGAAGLSMRDAMMRVFGEIAERYSTCFYYEDELRLATYAELEREGVEAIGPDKLPLFSETQFRRRAEYKIRGEEFFEPFTKDTKVSWVEGISLTTQNPVLVPAQCVYSGYGFLEGEVPITYNTSNGCAASLSYEGALLNAIYEVIERDAVMITWYSGLSPPRLDIGGCSMLHDLRSARLERGTIEYVPFYITLDIDIPIVLCLMVDRGGRDPVVMTGGACRLSPQDAAFKALLEAGQGRSYVKFLKIVMPDVSTINPHEIIDLEENLRFYSVPENFKKHMSFLFKSKDTVNIEEIEDKSTGDLTRDLKTVIDLIDHHNLTAVAVDLTPDDIAQVGFRVVRVLIPELVYLSLPSAPFAGNRRLYEVPKKMGYRQEILTEEDLNPMPHPYP